MRSEAGYTIMEALVSIVLIGLLITITVVFFNVLFNSAFMGKKNEAYLLAKNDMEFCLGCDELRDTLYFNAHRNIKIERVCKKTENVTSIIISATLVKNNKPILMFHAYRKR